MNKAVEEPEMVLPVGESRCYVGCKSQPIQEVKFKPVALRSTGRDSRLREKGYYWVCIGRL